MLGTPPSTDALFLETDNGDNPAIELRVHAEVVGLTAEQVASIDWATPSWASSSA